MTMRRKGSLASARPRNMRQRTMRLLRRHIPLVNRISAYSSEDALSDLVAGITLGLTVMPQSIGYAQLAGVSPRFGMYSALVGGFVYALLGNVKEVNIGPTSLMAILTFQFTRDLNSDFVILLTFITGLVQLAMGVFRLGFLVDFISMPVVSGFTSATAVMVAVSQLKYLLGLHFRVRGFVNRIIALWQHMMEVKMGDAVLGFSSIALLLILKHLGKVHVGPAEGSVKQPTAWQRSINKTFWFVSICRNFICIFTTTLLAKLLHVHSEGAVPFEILGDVMPGLPPPGLPPFSTTINNQTHGPYEMVTELGAAVLVVPIIGVLANVAIAKSFSTGHTLDATQEMLALAVSNLLGALLQAMPTCGAFTRSAVAQASGVRTPMMGVYTSTVVIIGLSFFTPYFFFIPRATLAAVLICAVLVLFDFAILPELWRTSKRDLVTLLVTFAACLGFGVEVGLVLGMALDLTRLLHEWARPKLYITVCYHAGGEYVMLRPSLGLLFPGVDSLRMQVDEAGLTEGQGTEPVVLDCAPVLSLDFTGVKAFEGLIKDFEARGQRLLFFSLDSEVRDMLLRANLYNPLTFCDEEEDLRRLLAAGDRELEELSSQEADEPQLEEPEPEVQMPLNGALRRSGAGRR